MTTQSVKRTLSDPSSSYTTKKSCNEKVSVFGRANDLLKYHLVWYNEQHENPLEYYKISSKLRRGIVDYLDWFGSIERCEEYIQSLINESDSTPIVLIVSVFNSSSMQMTDRMSLFDFVHSIYIHRDTSVPQSWAENIEQQEKVCNMHIEIMIFE